jgi:hypothetical protein
VVRVHESRSRSGSQSARGTNPPSDAAKPDKAGKKAQKQIDPDRLNKAIRYLNGHPNQQVGQFQPGFSTFSAAPNAGRPALFQCGAFASRASNILPGSGAQFHRDKTNRQTVDANMQLCGSAKLLSETVPVPVRPQWGQQSATAQAFNAVIMRV